MASIVRPQTSLPVSHGQPRDAVLRCQEWIQEEVKEARLPVRKEDGRTTKCPPIALLVESDIGLIIHLIAWLGLGVPVLSPFQPTES